MRDLPFTSQSRAGENAFVGDTMAGWPAANACVSDYFRAGSPREENPFPIETPTAEDKTASANSLADGGGDELAKHDNPEHGNQHQ